MLPVNLQRKCVHLSYVENKRATFIQTTWNRSILWIPHWNEDVSCNCLWKYTYICHMLCTKLLRYQLIGFTLLINRFRESTNVFLKSRGHFRMHECAHSQNAHGELPEVRKEVDAHCHDIICWLHITSCLGKIAVQLHLTHTHCYSCITLLYTLALSDDILAVQVSCNVSGSVPVRYCLHYESYKRLRVYACNIIEGLSNASGSLNYFVITFRKALN